MKKVLFGFLLCLTAGFYVLPARAVNTGTDDDGVFYFPDAMADWCSLNFKDGSSEAKLQECFSKICSDYTSKDYDVKVPAKKRFNDMKLESIVNAFITAHEAKKQYANDNKEDKADKTNTDAAQGGRTVKAGNSDIEKTLQMQAHTIDMLKAVLIELKALEFLQDNCASFVMKKEAQEQ